MFIKDGKRDYLKVEPIIEAYHKRGNDVLVNRAVKEFDTKRMPFKKFETNSVSYYTMVVASFLYEAFKQDIADEIGNIKSYANTFRIVLVDFTAKIVHTGGKAIAKETEAVWERINIPMLWEKCNNPPTDTTMQNFSR